MNPHPTSCCWSPLGLSLLAVAALFVAPTSTFADSRTSSGEQRASQSESQRSKQQPRRGKYQYKHYESKNRVRGFHENPNRQPHFIEDRVGFKIQF